MPVFSGAWALRCKSWFATDLKDSLFYFEMKVNIRRKIMKQKACGRVILLTGNGQN